MCQTRIEHFLSLSSSLRQLLASSILKLQSCIVSKLNGGIVSICFFEFNEKIMYISYSESPPATGSCNLSHSSPPVVPPLEPRHGNILPAPIRPYLRLLLTVEDSQRQQIAAYSLKQIFLQQTKFRFRSFSPEYLGLQKNKLCTSLGHFRGFFFWAPILRYCSTWDTQADGVSLRVSERVSTLAVHQEQVSIYPGIEWWEGMGDAFRFRLGVLLGRPFVILSRRNRLVS